MSAVLELFGFVCVGVGIVLLIGLFATWGDE